ncbi:FCD domain-containing protein, partial [Streptacidiphilus melanogenes]|uniref:FCD domain-containing protein n=1 Tax=Streptacidiphilus melanogenes TaxID=411235 RepID=UPI0005AB8B11
MHRRFAEAEKSEVTELRLALEAAAARLAATRRTAQDLRLLQTALNRREEAWSSGDAEAFVLNDAAFHQAVMAASHNRVLADLYADLGEVLREELRETVGPVLEEHRYVSHDGILDAIRAGDAEHAAAEAANALQGCRS